MLGSLEERDGKQLTFVARRPKRSNALDSQFNLRVGGEERGDDGEVTS